MAAPPRWVVGRHLAPSLPPQLATGIIWNQQSVQGRGVEGQAAAQACVK